MSTQGLRQAQGWWRRGCVLLLLAALPVGLLHGVAAQVSSDQPSGDQQEWLNRLSDLPAPPAYQKPRPFGDQPTVSPAGVESLPLTLQHPGFWCPGCASRSIPRSSTPLFITIASTSYF
jgi:hypothetical protein